MIAASPAVRRYPEMRGRVALVTGGTSGIGHDRQPARGRWQFPRLRVRSRTCPKTAFLDIKLGGC